MNNIPFTSRYSEFSFRFTLGGASNVHESRFNVECGSLKVTIVNLAQVTIVVTVETRQVYNRPTKSPQQWW